MGDRRKPQTPSRLDQNEMNSSQNESGNQIQMQEEDEEDVARQALGIARGIAFPMALKAAMEMNILNLVSEAGDLSASDLASRIAGCTNPDAPVLLDRMLSLLTSFSVLRCSLRNKSNVNGDEGGVERVYRAAPISKYFLTNRDGVHGSFGPLFLLHHDQASLDAWGHFKEAIIQGGDPPFERAHGMRAFQYTKSNPRFNKVFNEAMSNHTSLITNKIIDSYLGFHGVNVLVDVGGGTGTTLNLITTKYPKIRGINFDLAHVLATAPTTNPGVEHVAGDMFESVPSGDAIFMKWILHDWSDEQCLKLLKNCWRALPDEGKVIVVETVLPLAPDNSYESQIASQQDLAMFVHNHGGKERTKDEFQAMALVSGFLGCRPVCCVYNTWVMEFYKAL